MLRARRGAFHCVRKGAGKPQAPRAHRPINSQCCPVAASALWRDSRGRRPSTRGQNCGKTGSSPRPATGLRGPKSANSARCGSSGRESVIAVNPSRNAGYATIPGKAVGVQPSPKPRTPPSIARSGGILNPLGSSQESANVDGARWRSPSGLIPLALQRKHPHKPVEVRPHDRKIVPARRPGVAPQRLDPNHRKTQAT